MNIDSKWQGASVPAGIIKTPHQGVCPDGWHIPTKEEWETLSANVNYLSLQAPYNNLWPNASNLSGFSALPVGSYELGRPRDAGEVIYFGALLSMMENMHINLLFIQQNLIFLGEQVVKNIGDTLSVVSRTPPQHPNHLPTKRATPIG